MNRTLAASLLIGSVLATASLGAAAQYSTPMRDVENPDRFPYYEYSSVNISTPFVNGFAQFPTPKGSRYFIEEVTVSCTTPSNTDVFTQALLSVTKQTSSTSTAGFGSPGVVMQKRGPSFFGGYIWDGSAHVKFISDASPFSTDGSGALYLNIFHTDTSVAVSCFATMFGHSLPL